MVSLNIEDFGNYHNDTVKKFTWKTSSGFSVSVISYGAIIQAVKVPDKNGVLADVTLGFDDLQGYVERNIHNFGSTIGRCINLIRDGAFTMDGVPYKLTKSVGKHHQHGGFIGFDKVHWQSHVEGTKVTFSYLSKDGEEGYPGDLLATVSYEVGDDDSLRLVFQATTTKKTVVNLSNHAYFNLAGHETGPKELFNHVITMNANRITENDSESIPTGKFIDVGGTPYDLRAPTRIGDVIHKQDDLFTNNFCISTYCPNELNFVARVVHPSSRFLEVFSDQPGVQLYTCNTMPTEQEPGLPGKDNIGYRRYSAFCLETQKYPDAVHHEHFPSVYLSPGEVYKHKVVYKFGAQKA